SLDDSERVHMRILQTIYRQLTRSRLGCPRYGTHWEELGFQGRTGNEPWAPSQTPSRAALSWPSSQCPAWSPGGTRLFHNAGIPIPFQNFPFCIMSVNITRMVIQALREERLSRECNRRQQVIGVLNELHAAAFLRLSRLWKRRRGTVADAGFILKELELSTKKKPRQLLRSLESYVS
ncbi:ELMD3 protein, partial [Scytalopus superciliaris]|nr:ELMD3 protein [Scytalopus superciliaris]